MVARQAFEIGLPAALVPVAMRLGTALTGPQYLALHRAGFTKRATIKQADPEELLVIFDGDKDLRARLLEAAEELEELDQAA